MSLSVHVGTGSKRGNFLNGQLFELLIKMLFLMLRYATQIIISPYKLASLKVDLFGKLSRLVEKYSKSYERVFPIQKIYYKCLSFGIHLVQIGY